jgi:hypothetical protein
MNNLPSLTVVVPAGGYETARFNALQHGVLSRHAVLPWEDRSEYQTLLDALVEEHTPLGPTEEHLVEEIAGIIWRKRRLRIAEAAIIRERLREEATGYNRPEHVADAALIPRTGLSGNKVGIPKALGATATETARDLRDLKRDQAMSQRALNILQAGEKDAYSRALAALWQDTRVCWLECLEEGSDNGRACVPTAEALSAWIMRKWKEWYSDPVAELEHRDAIREQAFGSAYATQRLEVTSRYEVHLDRKLERVLAMLIRLRQLRRTTVPG